MAGRRVLRPAECQSLIRSLELSDKVIVAIIIIINKSHELHISIKWKPVEGAMLNWRQLTIV